MHSVSIRKIQVAVVGGSGYSGLELLRLLKKHPFVDIKGMFNSQNASSMNPLDFDLVFLATPIEVSVELTKVIQGQGVGVIDLSGAFRLNSEDVIETYQQWYGINHLAPELVAKAQYGLSPWNTPSLSTSNLVANPGCYATAILMGLLPLLLLDLILVESVVIDAKSGATGAGKKAVESQLFSEVDGECLPYKVGTHQHLPEIKLFSNLITKKEIDPFLTTSLIPTRRGIIAGIYAKLKPGKSAADVTSAFQEFYHDYPLVEFAPTIERDLISLKKIVGTAKTHISFSVIDDKIYLFSCIDNLLKGAASQAIENFNYLYHFPVTTGLDHLEAII
jgi:N-acetyl-gamma-glutamyl-phosphate reductase